MPTGPFYMTASATGVHPPTGIDIGLHMESSTVIEYPDPQGMFEVVKRPHDLQVQGEWPVRVFQVKKQGGRFKRGVGPRFGQFELSQFAAIGELPQHSLFGPNGKQVQQLLDTACKLNRYQFSHLCCIEDDSGPDRMSSFMAVHGQILGRRLNRAIGNARSFWQQAHPDRSFPHPLRDAISAVVARETVKPVSEYDAQMEPWNSFVAEHVGSDAILQ